VSPTPMQKPKGGPGRSKKKNGFVAWCFLADVVVDELLGEVAGGRGKKNPTRAADSFDKKDGTKKGLFWLITWCWVLCCSGCCVWM